MSCAHSYRSHLAKTRFALLTALCNLRAAKAGPGQAFCRNPVHVAADIRRNVKLLSRRKGSVRGYPQPVTVWTKLYGFLGLQPFYCMCASVPPATASEVDGDRACRAGRTIQPSAPGACPSTTEAACNEWHRRDDGHLQTCCSACRYTAQAAWLAPQERTAPMRIGTPNSVRMSARRSLDWLERNTLRSRFTAVWRSGASHLSSIRSDLPSGVRSGFAEGRRHS